MSHQLAVDSLLRSVRIVVEPSHENDAVNSHAYSIVSISARDKGITLLTPLQLDHRLCFGYECSSRNVLVASLLCLDELTRLWKAQTDQADNDREASSNPEHDLPAVCTATNTKVDASCKDIAYLCQYDSDNKNKEFLPME